MRAVDRNSAAFDLPAVRGRTLDYCIASTPHSGSSLLSEALWTADSAGAPHEYFKRGQMARLAERWGVGTIDTYVGALRRNRTTGGGVFGFSAHYHQFEDQIGDDLMECHFADIRPVLFRRGNRLEQAVAWSRATQLEIQRSEGPGSPAPRFDEKQIGDLIEQIEFEEQGWRSYFRSTDTVPHEVLYEDLLRDYEGTVRGVFDYLGLQAPDVIELAGVTEARNQPDELWAWRFRKGASRTQKTGRAAFPPLAGLGLTPPTKLHAARPSGHAVVR